MTANKYAWLSRECDRRPHKRPQLSDLRDSGSIEQDGDRILMLYRESEYFEDCENPDMTNVFVRKNRHGPTGSVDLRFDKTRMSFFLETIDFAILKSHPLLAKNVHTHYHLPSNK